VWIEDASIAALVIQLQSHDLGLGSCWVQVYNREKEDGLTAEEYIRRLLDVPAHYAVLNVVSIGYSDEERKPYDEEKLAYEKIHEEKF
jgi:nitroreductase